MLCVASDAASLRRMSEATRHYTGEEGRRYHESKRGIPEASYNWVARLRSEKISPHISPEDTVFEFGAGSGWNLASLNCKRRIASDVSDFLAEKLRTRGIEFVADPATLAENSIDIVICHHALEHVLNPPEILRQIHRLLNKNGKLVLFVPFEKECRYRHFSRGEPNHHFYSWNTQTLGNLVEELGFTVEQAGVGEFGYDRFAASWADKFNLGE